MSSQGQLHFTFSTKQPSTPCEPAPLHPFPSPHSSSAGHSGPDSTKETFYHLTQPRLKPFQAQHPKEGEPSQAHQAEAVRECCFLSESPLQPPAAPVGASPVCVGGRAALLVWCRTSMYPLSQTPFRKETIQTGRPTLGRFITRQQPSADSFLSLSPSFLGVGVVCGEPALGGAPLFLSGLPMGQDSSRSRLTGPHGF